MIARRVPFPALAVVAVIVLATASRAPLLAQDDAAQDDAQSPQPATTSDPQIPLDHLSLLVKPLTRDELAAEADAWRDLLKTKVQKMSDLQIDVKQKPGDAELTAQIPALQDEIAHLIDRLNVVLDAWELKGGDVEQYRQYVAAVSGIELNISDGSTAWAAIRGWLVSEQGGQRWMWNILKFLAILAAFYILARILAGFTARAASRISGASELLKKFLANFVKQVTLVIGVIVAISALEVSISPLLAAIGGAAFVVGLALQGTLSNFASGMIILGYRPFDEGDVIEGGGVSGIVDSMSLLSTRIRTFDNKVMIVPNNKIATDTIVNASASDTRRVDLKFGIGYDDDVEKARQLLESIVKNHPAVLDDPAPVIQLNELADSSVNFICRPWVKAADYWSVYWDVTRTVKQEFDRNGISIPFPQRDVHVYQQSSGNGAKPAIAEEQQA